MEEGGAELLGMGLTGSITRGAGSCYKMVPGGGGVFKEISEGGIGGVRSFDDCCEEPWTKDGHGDSGEGVLTVSKDERGGDRLWLGAGLPLLPFQRDRSDRFDHPSTMEGGWIDTSSGAMIARLLFDGESH